MSEIFFQISTGTRSIPTRPRQSGTEQAFTQSPTVPIHAIGIGSAATMCGILAIGMTRWDRPFGQGGERCHDCSAAIAKAGEQPGR